MSLLARAMPTYDREQPPVGRVRESAEKSDIQTKTFHERKSQNHPQPEALYASRWSGTPG
jgi:hypothetical protein